MPPRVEPDPLVWSREHHRPFDETLIAPAFVVATLVDVIVLDKDPAEEEVPTVLFPAQEAEE